MGRKQKEENKTKKAGWSGRRKRGIKRKDKNVHQ